MLQTILKQLIRFKTISHNHQENERAFDWIKHELKGLPVYIQEFKANKFTSLIITTQKTKKPLIFLAAHLDVVPGGNSAFKPVIKSGKLFGRGAFDMKYAIACYIKLFQELGDNLKKYDIGIMITSDEELGGNNGVKYLLMKGYKSKVCILPDGGNNWQIIKSSKGVWQISVNSRGKSAHSSKIWTGESATENLLNFLALFKKQFPKEPCGIKDHYHNTINIGRIEGGAAINQVPDFASAVIDIRFISADAKKRLRRQVNNIKKQFKKIIIKELASSNAFSVDTNNFYVKLFSGIAYEKFNIKTKFSITHGSSDARFFVQKHIPVIITRPKGGGHHSEKEWIDLNDLEKFYNTVKEFVLITRQ